jgi:nucleoside-diphosphate-sugar epimerase
MARVLLTGSSGGVGRAARPVLEAAGWAVEPFDLIDGKDLRDEAAVLDATAGCQAVVHAGAIAHDPAGTPAEIVATNLLGTWHVLQAAETHSVSRVVYFSSAQVFGFAEGEGTPAYLPVDDTHPRPVLILTDLGLRWVTEAGAELGAFVHVDDVATAVLHALSAKLDGHFRLTLCGPGQFDTSATRQILRWRPSRGWPSRGPSA